MRARLRRPLILVSSLFLASALLPSAVSGQELGPDHFKCYDIQAPPSNQSVVLRDQFDALLQTKEQVTTGGALWLCNPTTKRLAGSAVTTPIGHRRDHLMLYRFGPPGQVAWGVRVRNQLFNRQVQTLILGQAFALAVPTAKRIAVGHVPDPGRIPTGLDHYKCYPVQQGSAPNIGARLVDQFDRFLQTKEAVTIGRPRVFCNPVEKTVVTPNGNRVYPIRHPDVHYVCYEITPPGPGLPFTYRNQLSQGQGTALRSVALCVPSEKLVYVPLGIAPSG